MKLMEQYIGEFEVTSNKLIVTDPCYDKAIWCSYVLGGVKNGIWKSAINISDEGDWGNRVAELLVWKKDEPAVSCIELASTQIGVDSGQAGFFDYSKYPDRCPGEYGDLNSFYGKACAQTYDEKDRSKKAGIVEGFGVNSSSGFGDGCYTLLVGRNSDGEVVRAKLIFIGDEEYQDGDDDHD